MFEVKETKQKNILETLREVVEREYDPGMPSASYDAFGNPQGSAYPYDRVYNAQRIMELLLSDRCKYLPQSLRVQLTSAYDHEQRMNRNPRYIPGEEDYRVMEWLKRVRETVEALCFEREAAFRATMR